MWKVISAPLSNKLIISASVIVFGWLLICAYFLPPRGVDDIIYHLPFIYESIQRGRWTLLPVDLRVQFAYPMNAEVLYSWSVLFLKNTRWVDASQLPIGAWTAGIIYLFSRHFGLRRARAFFISCVFFLTPIVIAQMGTDYIDVVSAGFLLCSLYLTVRFLMTSKKVYVRLAFLSIGTMMGIKYHLLYWGLFLTFALFLVLVRKKWTRELLWGLLAVALLGAGWHLRNYFLFSDWLYPCTKVTSSDLGMGHQSLQDICLWTIKKINFTFLKCANNGTVDGGFGRFYGFIIFFSWVCGSWIFLFRKNSWKKGEVLLFLAALSFTLLLIPIKRGPFPWLWPRMFLAAWPIFLIIFGRIYFVINKKIWIQKMVLVFCIAGMSLDSVEVAGAPMPHHHWWGISRLSEFDSYTYSSWYVQGIGPCAAIVDALTRKMSRQASVFLAAPDAPFISAPFYGRNLQTKIINFDPAFKGDPDFLVYLTLSDDPLLYIGPYRKTLPEAFSSGYKRIYTSNAGIVFAHPRLFKRGK